jgi:chloramphenicol-sensitive protein RarD
MDDQADSTLRQGLLYGIAAYGIWGVVPLYFHAVGDAPPEQILAHRIVWSVILLALLIQVRQRWSDLLRCIWSRRTGLALLTSAILVAGNWFIYIYGIASHQVLQTSLGYFINPLVNVMLGMIFFRERLRLLQWVAVGLAAIGVIYLTLASDQFPWIALALGFSFAFYGLVRKVIQVDSLLGLTTETLFLLPVALACQIYWIKVDRSAFGSIDTRLDILLILSGFITAIPLLFFGAAARRLPLSLLGFLQYLAPTLQFLLAVTFFSEPFESTKLVSFLFIWTALVVYSFDSWFAFRARRASDEMCPSGAKRQASCEPIVCEATS